MTRSAAAIVLALFGTVAELPGAAQAASVYEIRPGEPNLVRFESKAPLESFEGRTRQVRGSLAFDPANLGDSVMAVVEVDLKSLDTGIPLRNEHMRANHLETERFPSAVLRIRRLEGATALEAGRPVTVQAIGDFELHGVSQRVRVLAEVTLGDDASGGSLRIVARFDVRLSDYQIARPKFLVLKLDERQRVTAELEAVPRK